MRCRIRDPAHVARPCTRHRRRLPLSAAIRARLQDLTNHRRRHHYSDAQTVSPARTFLEQLGKHEQDREPGQHHDRHDTLREDATPDRGRVDCAELGRENRDVREADYLPPKTNAFRSTSRRRPIVPVSAVVQVRRWRRTQRQPGECSNSGPPGSGLLAWLQHNQDDRSGGPGKHTCPRSTGQSQFASCARHPPQVPRPTEADVRGKRTTNCPCELHPFQPSSPTHIPGPQASRPATAASSGSPQRGSEKAGPFQGRPTAGAGACHDSGQTTLACRTAMRGRPRASMLD